MTATQHLVLFWVFVAFFMIIAIVAILAIVGVIKTDRRFRNWAVGGFAAAIVGVVIIWAKTQPAQTPVDLFINLEPPAGAKAESFELVSGKYEYDEQSSSGESVKRSGSVELTAGQHIGWWTAKLPCSGITRPFRMMLKDKDGRLWTVRPFYPNYHNQQLVETAPSPSQPAASLSVLGLTKEAFAMEKQAGLRFNNYAKPASTVQGRTYYNWRVFVDEPAHVLARIAEVQYLLHPTFPNPFQVRTNPNDRFALGSSGWGQFMIQITIRFKDNTLERTGYYLDLTKSWP